MPWVLIILNRPFPSSPGPLYQNEVKCSAFDTKMIFHSHANKTHFSQERFYTWSHFESEGFWDSEATYYWALRVGPSSSWVLVWGWALIEVYSLFSVSSELQSNLQNHEHWSISGMSIVLWPITAKIRTCELATKAQCLMFFLVVWFHYAWLAFSLQHNNIPEIFLVFTIFPVWL